MLSLLPIISFHMISLSPCRAHWLRLRRVVFMFVRLDMRHRSRGSAPLVQFAQDSLELGKYMMKALSQMGPERSQSHASMFHK